MQCKGAGAGTDISRLQVSFDVFLYGVIGPRTSCIVRLADSHPKVKSFAVLFGKVVVCRILNAHDQSQSLDSKVMRTWRRLKISQAVNSPPPPEAAQMPIAAT